MAKLKTMVSEEVYDAIVRERETNAIGWIQSPDPEFNQLYAQIRQDRVEVLEKAILARRTGNKGDGTP